MLNLGPCPVFISLVLTIGSQHKIVGAKTQFLFDNDKGDASSLQNNYRSSVSKLKQTSNRVPPQFQFGTNFDNDVFHIIEPPSFTKDKKIPTFTSQYLRSEYQDASNFAGGNVPNQITHNYPLNTFVHDRPSAAHLIQPEPPNGNGLLPPHEETPHRDFQPQQHYKRIKNVPIKFGHFSNGLHSENNPNTPVHQFYPFLVSAAVRYKKIIRTRPAFLNPHAKQRIHTKNIKTYKSKMLHDTSSFEEKTDHSQLKILQSNATRTRRSRRDTNSRKKSSKLMHGSLLPVALTIMGENGELLSGRALLQHITVLLKNASTFESINEDDDLNNFTNGDVLLNEKDFHHIMKNSMNLTNPVMLTVLGSNAINDSSLLTNSYVNEYLNCIDTSKVTNRFQALQTKIDCMKRKLFDNSNFEATGSSRYSISNLPAALVYADVMSNIKNLVRPKKGIAFYSLPVDELTHLQQVVLPIEEYVSQIHNAQFAPRNYHNRKYFFNENSHPRMPIWYLVKPDGRIYQTEGSRNHHPATIFHGFPDIPNADVFVEGVSRGPHFESMYYDE